MATILKKTGKYLLILLSFYLAACIVLSVYCTFGVLRWEIIENRGPFFILSVERTSLVGKDSYGSYWGYNSHGEILGFGRELPGFVQGRKVTSFVLFSPYSGIDGVIARWDMMDKM